MVKFEANFHCTFLLSYDTYLYNLKIFHILIQNITYLHIAQYLRVPDFRHKLIHKSKWLQLSRGSVMAYGTQVRRSTTGRSRRIFRAKISLALLPSEGK
jgi:hypothetical protein